MSSAIIFMLPSLISLVWTVLLLVTGGKDKSLRMLAALMAAAAVYFFCDAWFMLPHLDLEAYGSVVRVDVISQFLALAIPLMMVLYLRTFENRRLITAYTILLFLPPIMQGGASGIIYSILGFDNAAAFTMASDSAGGFPDSGFGEQIYRVYYIVNFRIYRYLLMFSVLYAIFYMVRAMKRNSYRSGDMFRFFFQGKTSSNRNVMASLMVATLLVCVVRIAVGRPFLLNLVGVSMLMSLTLSVLIFIACYVGVFFAYRDFSLQDFLHPSSRNAVVPEMKDGKLVLPGMMAHEASKETDSAARSNSAATVPQQQAAAAPLEARTAAELDRAVESTGVQNRLLTNFILYMSEKRPWLDPELSMVDVASELHSNRTYVSTLLSDRFGMSFREYINAQRINFAKSYILANPGAILEDVASESGFTSASQFVKKFSEMTGVTPRVWQAPQGSGIGVPKSL